jgi:hypothetical protein
MYNKGILKKGEFLCLTCFLVISNSHECEECKNKRLLKKDVKKNKTNDIIQIPLMIKTTPNLKIPNNINFKKEFYTARELCHLFVNLSLRKLSYWKKIKLFIPTGKISYRNTETYNIKQLILFYIINKKMVSIQSSEEELFFIKKGLEEFGTDNFYIIYKIKDKLFFSNGDILMGDHKIVKKLFSKTDIDLFIQKGGNNSNNF